MLNTDTLANIVLAIRSEAGHSLSTSQGTNTLAALNYIAQRVQRELWTAYVWPTLVVRKDVAMTATQYLYNFPAGFSFEQVRETWCSQSTSYDWTPVGYGIEEDLIAPGLVNSQSGDNVQFWDVEGDTQFRVWPTPVTSNYTIRFKGQRQLGAFIANSDMSTLDATAIALFAAAELLARAKAEDAPMKLNKAQKYVLALLGNSISAKRRVSTLASGAPTRANSGGTPYVDFIPQQQ
jgi:hypothetical protein